jgi:peptidoglycan glycosyltransferase
MSDDQLALSSIGQFDTTATPLQMAMVAAAVANGGEVKYPYLVERTTASDGAPVSRTGERTYQHAMNPSTAAQLRQLMIGVVEKGTGTNAAIDGAVVGGKTGTAQHGLGNTGTPYAWFIAWAQAENAGQPAVAVAVVVEDAEADRADISGGGDAAPIARAVMEAALDRQAQSQRSREGGRQGPQRQQRQQGPESRENREDQESQRDQEDRD